MSREIWDYTQPSLMFVLFRKDTFADTLEIFKTSLQWGMNLGYHESWLSWFSLIICIQNDRNDEWRVSLEESVLHCSHNLMVQKVFQIWHSRAISLASMKYHAFHQICLPGFHMIPP